MLRKLVIGTSAGLAAGTLVCTAMAVAQPVDSAAPAPEFNLQGEGINLAPLEQFGLSITPSQEDDRPALNAESAPTSAQNSEAYAANLATNSAPSTSSLPWYKQFTVAPSEGLNSAWGNEGTQFHFSAGERWGFTLGFDQSQAGPQFGSDDVTAGAFFDLNERITVGGEFRFSSPEGDVFGLETENKDPEIKFESAFRF
ncbi:NtrZ family periplasmic regulatory protein [Woodsholea maritima]|uniref:NtrZ family periplasmic regulatory protein n=1 Tax=Woodsholea maritima TaxID=240237 RepID=UPI0003805F47|nr:hypothetical protein [Woodsholea maritima]